MNFSKSLIAVSALAFLASCGAKTETPSTPATPAVETTTTTETTTTNTRETPATTTTETTTTSASATERKGNVTYAVPAGDTTVAFEIEFDANGNITDAGAELVSMAEGDMGSEMNIEKFDDAIDAVIVGKKIADIQSLNAVGGASLTTDAFKKFATDIK